MPLPGCRALVAAGRLSARRFASAVPRRPLPVLVPPKVAPRKVAPPEGAPLEAAPLEGAPLKAAPLEGAPPEGAPLEGALPKGAPPDSFDEAFEFDDEPEEVVPKAQAIARWSRTPPAMVAPIKMSYRTRTRNKVWFSNDDPQRLDAMYDRLLGPGGRAMLPEELKWLAITHKSFDYGRRGFNERLTILGRLTFVMEVTKHIISRPPPKQPPAPDKHGRLPFQHPRLAAVDQLSSATPKEVAGMDHVYRLATQVGMGDVVRWKPKEPSNLENSGAQTVMGGAILAIIGAITLQHGSTVASTIVRERILGKILTSSG